MKYAKIFAYSICGQAFYFDTFVQLQLVKIAIKT